MRYCADTQQRCRCSANTGWKVPGGHCVPTIMSQRKKGCESLTYPFPGFNFYICLSTTYTCQDNVSRLVLDSVEAWSRGLGRWFAKPVKSLKGLSQVRILLLPLRVAQFTLLSFDLGIERQTVWSSLYFRWGCHGSIHEPSFR